MQILCFNSLVTSVSHTTFCNFYESMEICIIRLYMTIRSTRTHTIMFLSLNHFDINPLHERKRDVKYSCQSCVLSCRAVESVVLLVGNKQDLCHVREVGWEEGQKLAMDNRCQFCELSAAEQCLEVEMMFIRIIKDILTNFKLKEKRRPSGSKSMAKLINNVFGKRRKSV